MAQTILEEKKKSRLMTEGSIWKSILLFSVPLILGNLLQQLYNIADTLIVGEPRTGRGRTLRCTPRWPFRPFWVRS